MIEHRRGGLVLGDVGVVGELRCVDGLDQLAGHRLIVKGGIDHHDVVEAGIGPQLRQHLLLGVEEVVDHLEASRLLEVGDSPWLVGAIALPVEHMHFFGGLGGQG